MLMQRLIFPLVLLFGEAIEVRLCVHQGIDFDLLKVSTHDLLKQICRLDVAEIAKNDAIFLKLKSSL